jgi:peptide deformylase
MILKSVQFPHSLLKNPCHLVTLDMEGLQPFIDDMVETLYHHPRCVGLAANQVGKPWRIMVVDASRVDKPGSQHGRLVVLNPFLVDKRDMRLSREGCLSVPDYTGNILRADRVILQGKDRLGNALEIKAEGFEAIILQHELDHLDGALFLDRVASLKTDVFRRKKYL